MIQNRPVVVVGSLNVDLVVTAGRYPHPGETITGQDFAIFMGGKGANQAGAVGRLGYPVHMVGRVGSDVFADQLLANLKSAGVDTDSVARTSGASGVALITRTAAGENSIVVVPGANHGLQPADLKLYWERIARAGIVLTQLETPMETLEALCAMTSAAGIPLMLDPAPVQALKPQVLRAVDWITPNEVEAAQLTGESLSGALEARANTQARILLEAGAKNVLLKLGENGSFLATHEGLRLHIPPWRVNVVDTTGAGDAFNGAFAASLMRGMAPAQAAEFASAASALAVTRPGAHATPSLDEVDRFMNEAGSRVSRA
jgi:ribokinase